MPRNKHRDIERIIRYMRNKKPVPCTSRELADFLGCEMKTIQNYYRDLSHEDTTQNYIEFVKMVKVRHGHYTIEDYRTMLEDDVVREQEKKVFLKLAIESLEDLSDLSQYHEEIEEDLKLSHLKTPYFIKSEEYQALNTDEDEIQKLEEAILSDHVITFDFKEKAYHVEPYRLVNFDGIWYLYGKDREEREENAYKTWMLKYIDNVEIYYGEKHDLPDHEIDKDLDEAVSAFFIPDREYTVKVKVFKEAAEFFLAKKYVPRQQIETQTDGSLIVTATVTTKADIDDIIKSWLPHIEILEPLEYRAQLQQELRAYLERVYG